MACVPTDVKAICFAELEEDLRVPESEMVREVMKRSAQKEPNAM